MNIGIRELCGSDVCCYLFIYFIDLSQKSLHNYTFQMDASKNITLYVKG